MRHRPRIVNFVQSVDETSASSPCWMVAGAEVHPVDKIMTANDAAVPAILCSFFMSGLLG